MSRWTAFADLTFAESAHLAFAKASEIAGAEAAIELHGAWLIEDRRIAFHADGDAGRATIESAIRVLDALVVQATSGEAIVELVDVTSERWARKAASPSISKEISIADAADVSETIRTQAS
jgi:hypothetical protein